ncbi:MAG: tetratricopeptide repeat protein [Acidobacteria bacterium]|nr:tetratricopeptide repeat protein [Acidobacteriota bacterium]MCW5969886.1 tetratricopeptide repeat protein [Blastocatellales bacterium]
MINRLASGRPFISVAGITDSGDFGRRPATLADCYMWVANFNDPDNPAWVKLMEESLRATESLDPQLAEIHAVRFEYYFSKYGGWDIARALGEAYQALALDPRIGHTELGTIYDHLGLDEARGLREAQRALELDPTNFYKQYRLIEAYLLYDRFDEAIEAQRRFFSESGPALALIGKGRIDEAQTLLENVVAKNPGDFLSRNQLALALALKGQFQKAEARIPAVLEQARNNRAYHHIVYHAACVYALAGKENEAVKCLREAAATGFPNHPLFARDPHLDRIRSGRAFVQFMAELKPRWEGYRRGLR